MKMRRRIAGILLICAAAVLLWTGAIQAEKQKTRVPDFTLMSNQGRPISLSDYAGRVVVLNFWTSWCPDCRAEMPELQRLQDELAETEEAVLLLLNQIDGSLETQESGKRYLEENALTLINLYDYGTVGWGIFGVPAYPATVVIDPEG
ncbi:MAG: TlpA family protein disulfide reductase, partial [Firmicutes bacterium]|nr:TlpA family protein disulfide reductase [Bacillota bacterium]